MAKTGSPSEYNLRALMKAVVLRAILAFLFLGLLFFLRQDFCLLGGLALLGCARPADDFNSEILISPRPQSPRAENATKENSQPEMGYWSIVAFLHTILCHPRIRPSIWLV